MTARRKSFEFGIGNHLALGAAALIALAAIPGLAQSPGGIAGVLAPGAVPELVQEGFTFTEGPVGTADGGLFFSDIRVNKTYFLDPGGKISVVRENTNSANGLALTKAFMQIKDANLRRRIVSLVQEITARGDY